MKYKYIRFFEEVGKKDVKLVGGKNSSLGEMVRTLKKKAIAVPEGFAITSQGYKFFLKQSGLQKTIYQLLKTQKEKAGPEIRRLIIKSIFPEALISEISGAYARLSKRYQTSNVAVAVRSSATAEDLPTASFAGQQESYLNVQGLSALLEYVKKCMASLFTDRAIAYREEKGFAHEKVFLSVGVQKMVRSDKGAAGVMFTLETESGFRDIVTINAAFGLGEYVVGGKINPDEYQVYKPFLSLGNKKKSALKNQQKIPIIEKTLGSKDKKLVYSSSGYNSKKRTQNVATTEKERQSFVLSDQEILFLARWAVEIEKHYQKPMDIEWAKDGITKKLYIVQARPETVFSNKKADVFKTFSLSLKEKERGKVLLKGLAIGSQIAAAPVQIIKNVREINKFKAGSILVTTTTTPDWVPIMKKSVGIITNQGGRTSHAAIVSRELNIPAIVGTEVATKRLKDKEPVTLDCAEGEEGVIYAGLLKYTEKAVTFKKTGRLKTKIMMNIASPSAALKYFALPAKGIGLARMEFIISNLIKIHPMALCHPEKVTDLKAKKEILKLTAGYNNKKEYFVNILAKGIAKIAASQYPEPVILRMSDFKTNEYAALIGGSVFEPKEENPMLGFRGASRYYNDKYKDGFALECQAVKKAREVLGFDNLIVMIPFCRTLEEADRVLEALAKNGLKRKEKGLQVYVMAEIPSNIILAEEFAKRFDGFSIGSNDLTQLILGIDRDSTELVDLFKEDNPAVKKAIQELIKTAHKKGRKVGICGQAPSDNPAFAKFLVKCGIDSISLNPDSVIEAVKKISRG